MERRYFDDEHILLRDMVREFAQNEVAPLAAELDQEGRYPSDLIPKMSELGLMGIPIPQEYGGAGMDTVAYSAAIHELAKVDGSVAITVAAHTSLGTMPILLFGSDDQKQRYLPSLAAGEKIGAFGLTEPEAGSDAGSTKTRAVLHGDTCVVNGEKSFCTNAGHAQVIVFTARLIEDGEDKGITAFIVEGNTPGLRLGEPEKKMGWRASDTRSLFFEDLEVPIGDILGTPAKGFGQFLQALVGGRISVGALALGTAEGAYQLAMQYAQEREAFGKKINRFQAVSFTLADMATQLEAAKHLIYHVSWLKDQGYRVIKEAAMAKLFTSELAMRITTDAIQLHGGYGYIRDYPVERFFRDAKVLEIGEGTSEVQRIVIAREIMEEIRTL